MTTDLRAALREAANHLDDIAPGADLAGRLRALADAQPTVAELLPLVDATHEVHWTDRNGRERIFSDLDYSVEMRPTDFSQPARLVEVA